MLALVAYGKYWNQTFVSDPLGFTVSLNVTALLVTADAKGTSSEAGVGGVATNGTMVPYTVPRDTAHKHESNKSYRDQAQLDQNKILLVQFQRRRRNLLAASALGSSAMGCR